VKIEQAIEYTKRELEKPNYDAQVAVLYLRDMPEVKEVQLNDLAWAIYQDGSAHKNDVIRLIELLEKSLLIPK